MRRARPIELFTFLSALLLAALPALAENFKCDLNVRVIDPGFRDADAKSLCDPVVPEKCWATIRGINTASKNLRAQLTATCDSVTNLNSDLEDAIGQSGTYKKSAQIYGQGVKSFQDYREALAREYNRIQDTLSPDRGPLGPSISQAQLAAAAPAQIEKQQLRGVLRDRSDKLKDFSVNPAPNSSAVSGDAALFAGRNGVGYMKKILAEMKHAESMEAMFQERQTTASRNDKKGGITSDPEDSGKKGKIASGISESSGFDMKSLAGLAAAGTGLAGLLQKKDPAPNTDTSSATAPTPNSTNNGAAGQGPAVSSLGGDKAPSRAPITGQAAPKPDATNAAGARTPSGYENSPSSDITKAFTEGLGSGASSPASAKSSGGGGGSAPGGDPGLAKSGPTPPSADDTQGLSSGGLGGGGMPSLGGSSSSLLGGDPAAIGGAASADDSMKDLLHEMKETTEVGNRPDLKASASDIIMSDEDLFPRVRAAYMRALRQGLILDGLAEKINE